MPQSISCAYDNIVLIQKRSILFAQISEVNRSEVIIRRCIGILATQIGEKFAHQTDQWNLVILITFQKFNNGQPALFWLQQYQDKKKKSCSNQIAMLSKLHSVLTFFKLKCILTEISVYAGGWHIFSTCNPFSQDLLYSLVVEGSTKSQRKYTQ